MKYHLSEPTSWKSDTNQNETWTCKLCNKYFINDIFYNDIIIPYLSHHFQKSLILWKKSFKWTYLEMNKFLKIFYIYLRKLQFLAICHKMASLAAYPISMWTRRGICAIMLKIPCISLMLCTFLKRITLKWLFNIFTRYFYLPV